MKYAGEITCLCQEPTCTGSVDIYIALTADQRDSWQSTMKHIACESRCFVIGGNQFVRKEDYLEKLLNQVDSPSEILCAGGGVVVDPFGKTVAGPLWDKSGILFAELDIDLVVKGEMDFDVAGHYARPDIFQLILK